METKLADSMGKLFGQTLNPVTENPADCANADARTNRPEEWLPRAARQRYRLHCTWALNLLRRPPAPVEHSQIKRQAQQRPLRSDFLHAPHRPAAKPVVVFDLAKDPFDNLAALRKPARPRRLSQPFPHRLHHHRVRSHFYLPPLGVTRAVSPHRTVPTAATIAFDPQALLGGVPFPRQALSSRTSDRLLERVVAEVLPGAGIIRGRFAFGWRH